jgi:predicted Zn finger-like uncharacterized protein
MPINTDCPSCNRKLRVPDDLLGKKVKCPTCGTTFTAAESNGGLPDEERRPAPAGPPAPPPDEGENEPAGRRYEDEDRPRRRRSRSYEQPHRGTLILVLGILGLVTGLAIILGPIAWVMGNNDLKEIRAGRMDPEGESTTNAGRICGIIATILGIFQVVCCVGYMIFIVAMIGAGAAGGNMH